MGKSLFIVLAVCLMFSRGSGISTSKSCSMVNGKWICNEETSQGNTAVASSSSMGGSQGSYQQTYAGAGNPQGNWSSSGQTVQTGNGGPPPSNDYFDFSNTDFQGAPGRNDRPTDSGCGYSSSGSAENFGTNAGSKPVVGGFGFASTGNNVPPRFPFNSVPRNVNTPQDSTERNGGPPVNSNIGTYNSGFQGTTGGFAGGPSTGGMSYAYSSSGLSPNFGTNVGPMPTVGGFGFASAGNVFSPGFPFNFVPGNAPQSSSQSPLQPNGGGPPGAFAGSFAGAGPFPGGFNPMAFVFGRR